MAAIRRLVLILGVVLQVARPFGRLNEALVETARKLEEASSQFSLGMFPSSPSSPGSPSAESGVLPTAEEMAVCKDSNHHSCQRWAREGECEKNPGYMHGECRASCRLCQSTACHDDHASCAAWAQQGECGNNAEFMLEKCRFSCAICNINFKKECRRDPSMKPAAVAGTIDATLRIALETFPQYRPRVIRQEPWILAFDSFLQEAEVDELLKKAGHNFERSLAGDGVTPVRTSSTSWCNVEHCLADPLVQNVRQRISNLTRVPWEYAEHLQVLQYTPGQFYKEHHDQNSPRHSAWGPRLYTFFMYLSDVEEGGETRFTHLNISVKPKKGSAIFWPSVLSDDPYTTDDRTYHEAVSVKAGVKYSANFWLHMYEFQQALVRGCDNSDYFQDDMLSRSAIKSTR